MNFFTSDLHFSHANICKGTSKWDNKDENCRDFETIEEMNSAIIESINSRVGENDTLYHLGDWSFGGWENMWNLRKQIICKNIIQINGNHDNQIVKDKFFNFLVKENGIITEITDKTKYRTMGMLKTKADVTAKDFFKEVHSNRHRIVVDKQEIIMDHYPLEDWINSESGTWMLHGHTHGKLKDSVTSLNFKRFDVGWNGKVYSFEELKEIMDEKRNKWRH